MSLGSIGRFYHQNPTFLPQFWGSLAGWYLTTFVAFSARSCAGLARCARGSLSVQMRRWFASSFSVWLNPAVRSWTILSRPHVATWVRYRPAMKQRRVGIGIVGMGFMGLTHLNASQTLKGGAVVAFVTADPRKARGDFRSVRGNFGNGGGRVNVKAYNVYPSLDQLLADDSVDLVDICLPSHLHASAATRKSIPSRSRR